MVVKFVDEQPSEARQPKAASRRVGERPAASLCSGESTRRDAASTVARYRTRTPLSTSTFFLHLLLLLALAAPLAATASVSAKSYVQTGLVTQWDAIENAGYGQHGDVATDGWTDLVGGCVLATNVTTGGSVTTLEKGICLTNASLRAYDEGGAATAIGNAIGAATKTVEIAGQAETYLTGQMWFCVQKTSSDVEATRLMLWYESKNNLMDMFCLFSKCYNAAAYNYGLKTKTPFTVSAAFSAANVINRYANGSLVETSTHSGSPAATTTSSAGIGLHAISYAAGPNRISNTVYRAVRVYNRCLSADEVLVNANVDKIRFLGADGAAQTWPDGFRYSDGAVEARLALTFDGAQGAVAVGTVTNAASAALWHAMGTELTLTPVPADGYRFYAWEGDVDGLAVGADGSITVSVGGPMSLTCLFAEAGSLGTVRRWTGSAGDGMWDTAGNWTPSGEPATNDAVVIDGGACVTLTNCTACLASLTLDGATLKFKEPVQCLVADAVAELRANDVAITNAAKVTHVRQEEDYAAWVAGGKGDWKIDGRVSITCGALSLDAKSSIIGDGLGYYCHSSVKNCMCGPNSFGETGNGGHGGYGYFVYPWRTDVTTHPCGPYDDPIHPVMPGTSGSQGDNTSSPGQAGGGAIRIAATGDVTVNGTISANSQRTGGFSRRAGAGGSVWISCRTISGGGIVRANGSLNTGNSINTLCGGGGCVAIHYDAAAQAALAVPDLRISSGVDFYQNTLGLGDVGTVYLTDTRFLRDEFNATRGVGGGNVICGDWSGWSPASLTVSSVWIRLPSGACKQLHLTGGIAVSGFGGRLDFGGEQFFMIQRAITPLIATQTVSVVVDGDVTLSDKGRLSVFAAATNGLAETWASLDVKGDLSIAANSVLELFSHPTNGASCHVSCENLTVAANGWVTAGGHGFGGSINGKDMNAYGPGGALSASGGAYGGFSNGHHPYGDWKKPLFAGSGGSRGDNWQNGSQAGGVVYLSVKGNCEMNGTLSADANGAPGFSAGSGSGGSVYVTAKTFTGKGRVTACGGNGQQDNNAGGGGRIALVCTDPAAQAALASPPLYTFNASTYGGSSGYRVLTSDFGSLYLSDTKMASDAFVANKIQHCQLYLDDWTDFALDRISQTNTFVRLVNAPSPLTIDSIFINNGWLEFGGDATHQRFSCRRPYRTGRGIDIYVAGDVTLTNSAQLTVRGGITNGNVGVINYSLAKTNKVDKTSVETALSGTVTIGGQLTVHKNAWVCPDSHPFDGGSVRFETKRLDIREGGGFDANARGWTTAQSGEKGGHGPGRGTSTARGGGYGGPANDGKVYGSAPMPLLPGSGSGCNINGSPCGAGGGLVWLTVRRHASILGTLRASGETTWGTFASGGSGGAICLRVPSFDCTTNTVFTAGGGGANLDGQVGAGGRIAVYTLIGTVSKDVKMSVNAGDSSASRRGTIHIGALPRGMMVILR